MQFLLFFFFLISNFFFLISPINAQCPICVVTVGGGMLIAEKLGIDDLLVSIWIAALNVALSFWLAPKIKIKYLNHPLILTLLMFLTTLIYFKFTDQIGVTGNTLLGLDKIIFGQILGLITMIGGNYFYQSVKARLGRAPFPYAKVVYPFAAVLITTLVFKFAFSL